MATTDAKPVPVKGAAYRVTFPIMDADGDLVTGATGLDSEVSKDAGTFADCTNEATEIATSSGIYYLDLTSTEMNADTVAVIVKTSSSGAKTTPIFLYPQEAGDIPATVEAMNAGTVTATAIADGAIDAATFAAGAINAAAIAADAITDAKVASDVTIASVTGAVGSVTGAVGSVTGNVGGNVVGSVGSVATGGITAASIAADAIGASELATDACQKIADVALRRTMASIEASSNGETLSVESLYGLIAAAFEAALSSTTLTVRKSDGSTLGTKTLTLDSGATPVVGIT